MQEKPPNHYVDNVKLYEAIVEHKKKLREAEQNNTEAPRVSEYLGDCFYKIAENYSYNRKFIQYPFRKDMVMDAVYYCVKYIDTFNPEKTKNPFSYFTTTCHNAFLQRIEKERRYLYTKYKAMENHELFDEEENQDNRKKPTNSIDTPTTSDHTQIKRNEFVEKYEKRLKDLEDKKKGKLNNV